MIAYLNGDSAIGRRTKKERKEHRKELKTKAKTTFKKVAKVGLTPARAMFVLAVELNGLNLAKRLAKAYKKNPDAVRKLWESQFKGDFSKLKTAIEKGSNTKLNGTLGIVLATALATATPIVIAVVSMLKSLGTDTSSDTAGDSSFIENSKQTLANDSSVAKEDKEVPADEDSTETPFYKKPIVIIPLVLGLGFVGYKMLR